VMVWNVRTHIVLDNIDRQSHEHFTNSNHKL
jgi:hypothetical protein